MGITIAVVALSGCGSDVADNPPSGGTTTSSSQGTGGSGQGGAGGDTTTTSTGGGGSGQGGQGGGGGAGGAPACVGFETCTNCLAAQCTADFCACLAETDCFQLGLCFQGCAPGDDVCAQDCMTQHESSISQAALVQHCGGQNCAADCPGMAELPPCQVCLFTNCSMQMNTCLADPACRQAVECAQACPPGDVTCIGGCVGNNAEAQAVLTCGTQQCMTECQ